METERRELSQLKMPPGACAVLMIGFGTGAYSGMAHLNKNGRHGDQPPSDSRGELAIGPLLPHGDLDLPTWLYDKYLVRLLYLALT